MRRFEYWPSKHRPLKQVRLLPSIDSFSCETVLFFSGNSLLMHTPLMQVLLPLALALMMVISVVSDCSDLFFEASFPLESEPTRTDSSLTHTPLIQTRFFVVSVILIWLCWGFLPLLWASFFCSISTCGVVSPMQTPLMHVWSSLVSLFITMTSLLFW